MRLAALILAFLVQAAAFGQIASNAETRFIVSGIEGFEIVGDLVLAPKTAKPQLQAVGYVEIESEAAIIRVRASDSRNMPVDVRQLEPGAFIVLGSGVVRVEVTVVDFDKRIFEQDEFQITITAPGPVEPPPPPPPPPISQDLVDISRRAAAALNDRETSAGLATTIRTTIAGIEQQCATGQCPGLDAVKASMVRAIESRLATRTGASRDIDWLNGWRVPINKALQDASTRDVPAYLSAMKAVATGLIQ